MGKLHKIRKAIEANPNAYMIGDSTWPKRVAKKARVDSKGKVYPSSNSHRNYVRKVLRDLGHNVR